jgi:signal peptide peptidase SppA
MSHKLLRLSSKVFNTPQLMEIASFENVVDYLESRNLKLTDFDKELSLEAPRQRPLSNLQYNTDTKVGIIPIDGTLSYVAMDSWCGGESASYQRILSDFQTMVDAGAKTIVIDADSGGGEAYGMMETSTQMRNIADDKGIKLITYIDGLAASAMYGIASATHEIIANPEAEAGSIGVVVSLSNYSEAEKRYGVKRTYITAGESKVPFTDDGEFTQEFKDDIKYKVDKLYDKFTSHVATYRNMEQSGVKALGAKVYVAEDAVAKGLVDKIMTREEFFDYLGEITEGTTTNTMLNFKSKTKDKEMSVDLEGALATMKANLETEFASTLEAALTSQAAEFATKLQTKDSELATALTALAEIETAKKEAKQAERVASLTAVVGTKAEAQAVKLADLSDEAFDSVLDMLKATKAASEDSVLMTELGDDGQEVVEDTNLSYEEVALAALVKLNNKQ